MEFDDIFFIISFSICILILVQQGIKYLVQRYRTNRLNRENQNRPATLIYSASVTTLNV